MTVSPIEPKYHSPVNIRTLLTDLRKARPHDQFVVPGAMLRELVTEFKVAHPPAAAPQPRSTPPLPPPLWLRPKDAVAKYGIRITLLYRLINEGRVFSKLIGGARVISVASLDALGDADPQTRRRGRPRRGADTTVR